MPASPRSPRFLRMPRSTLRELGRGGGGAAGIHLLRRAQCSKNLLIIRAAVALAVQRGHPEAGAATHGYRLLRHMTERDPRAAEALLGSPSTGLWALHTALGLREANGLSTTNPGLLADLAERFSRTGDTGSGARIQAEADGLRIDLRLDAVDHRYLAATRVDHALSTDARRLGRWRERIAAGWRILVRQHRAVAEEVAPAMSILVPEVRFGAGYSSATLRHGFGMLVMSAPPDPRAVATTFAHEIQHAKLAAIMDMFPLVKPGRADRFYAPWRREPRPAGALLHGAYAHLGVAGFWRRQLRTENEETARSEAEVEFVRWRDAAAQSSAMLLGSPVLTPIGEQFVALMAQRLEEWRTEPVSAVSRTEARRRGAAHRRIWLSTYGDPGTVS